MREYREEAFPVTIVRPSSRTALTMVPAGYHSWTHPWTLVDRMRRKKKIIVHGDGTSLWTMTHNTDLAKGFVGLLGNPARPGSRGAHHLGRGADVGPDRTPQSAAAAGVEPAIVPLPSDFIAAFDPEALGSLVGDKAQCGIFDNSKIKSLVPDFAATVPFAEGVARSVRWFEEHPGQCTIDEASDRLTDRIIDAYQAGLRLGGM